MKLKKSDYITNNIYSNYITKYNKEKIEGASLFYKSNYSMSNLNTNYFDITRNHQNSKLTNTFNDISLIDQKDENMIKPVFKNTYDLGKDNEYFNLMSSNNFPNHTKNKKISNIKSKSIKPKGIINGINNKIYLKGRKTNTKIFSNFDKNYYKNLLLKKSKNQITNYNAPNKKIKVIGAFNKKHDSKKDKLLKKIKNFLASDTKTIRELKKTIYKQSNNLSYSNEKETTNNIYEILCLIKNEIYKHFISNYNNISDYYDDWINYKNNKFSFNNRQNNVIDEEIFYTYVHHRFNINIDINKSKEIFNLILLESNIINHNDCDYLDINNFKKVFFDKKDLIISKNINNFYKEISCLSSVSKYQYLLNLINMEKIRLLNKTKEYNSKFIRDNDYNYDKETFSNLINALLPKNFQKYFINEINELFEKFCNKINKKINIIFFIGRISRNMNKKKFNKQSEDIKCNNIKNNILSIHDKHREIIDCNKTTRNFFQDYKFGVINLKKGIYQGQNLFNHQSKDKTPSNRTNKNEKIINHKMDYNIPNVKNNSLKKHSKNTDIIDFL